MSHTTEAPPAEGSPDRESELYRDIISQFPVLDAYTQIVFGFKLPLDVDRRAIVCSLQDGFDQLINLLAHAMSGAVIPLADLE